MRGYRLRDFTKTELAESMKIALWCSMNKKSAICSSMVEIWHSVVSREKLG